MSRRGLEAGVATAALSIAGMAVTTTRPDDLDATLVAATGCGSAEIEQLLGAGPDRAAAALRPFLVDQPENPADVARAIAADPGAIEAIRALYAGDETPAEQPAGEAA